MSRLRQIFSRFRTGPDLRLTLIMLLAFGAALWQDRFSSSLLTVSFATSLILILILGYDSVSIGSSLLETPVREGSRILAWLLLAAGLAAVWIPAVSGHPVIRTAIPLSFTAAAAIRFCGWKAAVSQLPAYFLCFLLPFFPAVLLYAGYPLRLLSTIWSAEILKAFHPGIGYELTVIRLDGRSVAITDACSGIQQVEAMLLLAYLIVRKTPLKPGWKIQHYLFLLPAVIIANVLRIMGTVLLYHLLGDRVFSSFFHLSLGWFQVAAAILLFAASGKLLPRKAAATGGES